MIIVFVDLAIVGALFLFIAFQKWNQDIISEDLDHNQITARDFTVEIRNLPPHDNIMRFKAELWQWIETLMKDHGPTMICPEGA